MINHRISAVWSTTKPIAAFSCSRRVQEVNTKAEVTSNKNIHFEMILDVGIGEKRKETRFLI